MSSSQKLIVFGSIVQDLVSYVDRYPKPGESVRGNLFKTYCGGKGANQAVMAALLGANVTMIGRVGNDIFGEANIKAIKEANCDTSLIQKSETAATGTGSITVTNEGENCIVVTLGSNLELNGQRAIELESVISKASMILCQSEVDQTGNLEAFRIAKRHNVTTFFNPAPGKADLDLDILPLTDIICTNENETEFITKRTLKTMQEFEDAAKQILEFGPSIVIVTLGPKGVIVAQKNAEHQVSLKVVDAPQVKAVDTTGAGDCFCGSLAYFLLAYPNTNVIELVPKAVKIASLSVQRKGPQASYPRRAELEKLELV